MPEYLAPGVYVEETSFRAKSIEGVGTSTTAFVGPTRKGPFRAGDETPETPELLTSYGDFERIYGGFADLDARGGRAGDQLSSPTPCSRSSTRAARGCMSSRVVGAGATAASGAVRGGAADEQVHVRRALPRDGSATDASWCVRWWRRLRPRRWPRPQPARCCAPVRPAAPVHNVKVGNDWRPGGQPRRACR